MAGDVKVLLLEDIDSLGSAGDIVTVSEGYARNKLFTEGKAALATEQEQEKHKSDADRKAKKAEAKLVALEEKAEQLDGTELQLSAKVNEGDELFGSITSKHIVEELNKQAGLVLTAKQINIDEPIKHIGTYAVVVKLSDEIEFTIVVAVIPEDKK